MVRMFETARHPTTVREPPFYVLGFAISTGMSTPERRPNNLQLYETAERHPDSPVRRALMVWSEVSRSRLDLRSDWPSALATHATAGRVPKARLARGLATDAAFAAEGRDGQQQPSGRGA